MGKAKASPITTMGVDVIERLQGAWKESYQRPALCAPCAESPGVLNLSCSHCKTIFCWKATDSACNSSKLVAHSLSCTQTPAEVQLKIAREFPKSALAKQVQQAARSVGEGSLASMSLLESSSGAAAGGSGSPSAGDSRKRDADRQLKSAAAAVVAATPADEKADNMRQCVLEEWNVVDKISAKQAAAITWFLGMFFLACRIPFQVSASNRSSPAAAAPPLRRRCTARCAATHRTERLSDVYSPQTQPISTKAAVWTPKLPRRVRFTRLVSTPILSREYASLDALASLAGMACVGAPVGATPSSAQGRARR